MKIFGASQTNGRTTHVAQPSSAAGSRTVPVRPASHWRRDAALTRWRGRLRHIVSGRVVLLALPHG
jgi:hypothetical protein